MVAPDKWPSSTQWISSDTANGRYPHPHPHPHHQSLHHQPSNRTNASSLPDPVRYTDQRGGGVADWVRDSKDYDEQDDGYYARPPELPPPLPPLSQKQLKQQPTMTHLALMHTTKKRRHNWRMFALGGLFSFVAIVLVTCIVLFFLFASRTQQSIGGGVLSSTIYPSQSIKDVLKSSSESDRSHPHSHSQSTSIIKVDMEVSPNFLLTMLITQRKVCLFEASSDLIEQSRAKFLGEHIESARLLYFGNLSSNGAPVHPLQFQRYVRNLGVDEDCHVIIYDRGPVLWATYAYWIFSLFGHRKVSILNGGFKLWKKLQSTNEQYRTEQGPGPITSKLGHFRATWNEEVICTFDDVIANTETAEFDLVDTQTQQEYDGQAAGALFGHIRSSINVPNSLVYNVDSEQWLNNTDLQTLFLSRGLKRKRGVIVYCSSSTRASMVWWALLHAGYKAQIYFGSWTEWIIRAPDYLKVMPDKPAEIETPPRNSPIVF